jgi:hypothetical protein
LYQVRSDSGLYVVPMIHFLIRYDQHMSGTNWLYGHDAKTKLIFPDEMTGNFSGKNFSKDAGHVYTFFEC